MFGTWKTNLIVSGLVVCLISAFWALFFGKSSVETQENNDGSFTNVFTTKTESTKDNWILAPGETEKEFVLRQISPLIANFSGKTPGVKLKNLHQGATGADFLRAVRRQIAFHRPPNVYIEDEKYIYVWAKGYAWQGEILEKTSLEHYHWTTREGVPEVTR